MIRRRNTGRPPLISPDFPHANMSVSFSCSCPLTAHIYFTVEGDPAGIVLVTLGGREENLQRVQNAYAALGWRLVGTEEVRAG